MNRDLLFMHLLFMLAALLVIFSFTVWGMIDVAARVIRWVAT